MLHAVGKKCGIDPVVIDSLDLENVVERTIAINEGREPPEDLNEEFDEFQKEPLSPSVEKEEDTRPPSEDCPLLSQNSIKSRNSSRTNSIQTDLIIQNPTSETLSDLTPSVEINIPPFKNEEFVAIDMDSNDLSESALIFENTTAISHTDPVTVPIAPDISFPEDLESGPPIMIFDDTEEMVQCRRKSGTKTASPPAEPRKFKEKKERYGRDPTKLYETYKEEWDRLERLSAKNLGPRRKSILTAGTSSMHSSVSSNNFDPNDNEEGKQP
ncbi:hypothetical protein FO519_002656 [Halicephalobus sp. NKZ332]|nr:hypothetical protein FO519_002656 [Halicephalobus sp. NKZ332]